MLSFFLYKFQYVNHLSRATRFIDECILIIGSSGCTSAPITMIPLVWNCNCLGKPLAFLSLITL